MTHDELIGRTAMAICRQPGSLCAGQCHQEICRDAIKIHGTDARAAIRVIAPAVLEEAAKEADKQAAHAKRLAMEDQMTDTRVTTLMASERLATAIRALKTRYEQ